MSTTNTIALVFTVLVLGVGGVYAWRQMQGGGLVAEGQVVMAEATEFGASTDNQGCLDASIERYAGCDGGFTCKVMSNVFFLRCLEASAPAAGFCDGVPPKDSIKDAASWRANRCAEHGLGDAQCPNFFGQVQDYCDALAAEAAGLP